MSCNFFLLLQRAWLTPTDGSYREANLDLIEGKDSVARAVVNTVALEPGKHLPGRLALYSEKSMALEMRSLCLWF